MPQVIRAASQRRGHLRRGERDLPGGEGQATGQARSARGEPPKWALAILVARESASAGPGSAADGPVMLMMFSPSTTIVASARSGLTPSNSGPPAIVVRAWLLIADPFWPVYPAALHNELGVGKCREVEHRVPGHEHEVGELSRLDRADAVIDAEQRRRVTGGGLHRIHSARTVVM